MSIESHKKTRNEMVMKVNKQAKRKKNNILLFCKMDSTDKDKTQIRGTAMAEDGQLV